MSSIYSFRVAWALLELILVLSLLASNSLCGEVASPGSSSSPYDTGSFKWTVGPPVLSARENTPEITYFSIKDPSLVRFEDRWHIFCTVRGRPRTHQIEYLSLTDWEDPSPVRRMLEIVPGYYCAPQVFYFRPRKKWYLLYQTSDPQRKPALQPAVSTNDRVDGVGRWSPPEFLFPTGPENVQRWIDFWVICDDTRAYLFFTSLDGRFWRSQTALSSFPHGWDEPQVVLETDIFEAAHVYSLRGRSQYLAIIEAQNGSRRYYKAFLAERLDGKWHPLAASREKPFLGPQNVTFRGPEWCQSFSHGELLREGYDERMEVNPDRLVMIFQGVSDREMAGKSYGEIPWRIGLAYQQIPSEQ
ncbi:MAG: non-reducing end alpha-L-arabinofuranosidase family hydrolase [Thermogutta sp.]